MSSGSPKLDALQSLRSVAALLVVVDHAILILIEKAGLFTAFREPAASLGHFGVVLFFGISGFIMAYTNGQNFGNERSLSFIWRRLKRVAPLYWLATLIYAGRLTLGGEPPDVSELVRSLLFIPYEANSRMQPVLGQGWTLNYEFYFYALFAAAMILPLRAGLALMALYLLGTSLFGVMTGQTANTLLGFYLDPIVLFFLVGISAFYLADRMPTARLDLLAACASGAALIFVSLQFAGAVATLFALAALFLLLAFAHRAATTQAPASSLLVKLGDASYSIYLFHGFTIGPLAALWGKAGLPNDAWPLFVVVAIAASSVVGWAVFVFVERPLSRIGGRKPKLIPVVDRG